MYAMPSNGMLDDDDAVSFSQGAELKDAPPVLSAKQHRDVLSQQRAKKGRELLKWQNWHRARFGSQDEVRYKEPHIKAISNVIVNEPSLFEAPSDRETWAEIRERYMELPWGGDSELGRALMTDEVKALLSPVPVLLDSSASAPDLPAESTRKIDLTVSKRLGEVISDADKAKVIALKTWLATNAPTGSEHRTTAVAILKAVAKQAGRADVLLAWDTLTTDKADVEATLEELSFAVV
eukprot:SAG31_NODE_3460_length_4248_cov_2.088696_3_plen_237_part_00